MRHNWGADQAYYRDDSGRVRLIPIAWTNLNPADPVVLFGEGRSPFRLADLLELARLLDVLSCNRQAQSADDTSVAGDSHV
jgi:hypothetical protein